MRQIKFDHAKFRRDDEGSWLMLRVPLPYRQPAQAFVREMRQDKLHVADIKLHREKRSLDANAYFWKLCGELAAAIGTPKSEIYMEYVKEIGNNFEIVPVRDDAVDQWVKNWSSRGDGWPCVSLGPSKLAGYTNLCCYYGSSTYDTGQMSRLIDLAVYDCQAQDIETKTPEELARLKAEWENAPHD